MKKHLSFFFIIFSVIAFVTLYAQTTTIRDFNAASNGLSVTLTWRVEGDKFSYIEIWRKIGQNGEPQKIGSVPYVDKSSYTYEFVDQNVYKSSSSMYIEYELKVDGNEKNGNSLVGVSHSVSSVKRTWGSIKAMFR